MPATASADAELVPAPAPASAEPEPEPGAESDWSRTALALREEFLLDPDVVFLNHGSFGACPRPVLERYQAWQRELERQPVEFLLRRYRDLMRTARERLASYVGTAADNLVYVPNATTGVNIVAGSLKLGPGDEVLATDHEYGACDRTWRFVCARRGADYRRASVTVPVSDPEEVVEQVFAAVTGRTRLLFFSHIASSTALVLPVAALCARARETGILSVVDGAHGPGQVDLALDALAADYYVANCHKWLCSPKGAGFLYVRPKHQPLLEPLVVSWGAESMIPAATPFITEFEFAGTVDIAPYLSVPAAIDFQAAHDWPTVRRHCHELARQARSRLLALPGVSGLHPDDPTWFKQMAAVAIPPHDPIALMDRLYGGHRVEVPVISWGGRTLLRVSAQGYNTAADIDRLLDAVADCLPGSP